MDPHDRPRDDPADEMSVEERSYVDLRPLLFSIAYQMTGSIADAEDIVAESYLRLHRALDERRGIENLKQYLSTTVTLLSIDHLRASRKRRETYAGPWLPEPLVDTSVLADFERVELADTLSMAFLVLLESLSPTERAVFILREVFEFDYPELARVIGKSEANCRQVLHRARREIELRRPRFDVDASEREELAARFFSAIEDGDLEPLVTILSADVVTYGDGGGNGPSLPQPIHGREKVLRFLALLADMTQLLGMRLHRSSVNGQPGALVYASNGRLLNVLSLDIQDGQIQTIRSIINRDKLRHLGALADSTEITRQFSRARRHQS